MAGSSAEVVRRVKTAQPIVALTFDAGSDTGHAVVPGAIYLFHVGAASTDAAALQSVIDGLRTRGFGFATASGLLALTGT